jgi:uncharacterized protein with HEPN domain
MTPRDAEAFARIAVHIAQIESYVAMAGADWADDAMAVDAILKRLEEIGEQAKRVGAGVLAEFPEVDWVGVKGIRDVIAHDYDDVDVEIIRASLADDLPGLKKAVVRALS